MFVRGWESFRRVAAWFLQGSFKTFVNELAMMFGGYSNLLNAYMALARVYQPKTVVPLMGTLYGLYMGFCKLRTGVLQACVG